MEIATTLESRRNASGDCLRGQLPFLWPASLTPRIFHFIYPNHSATFPTFPFDFLGHIRASIADFRRPSQPTVTPFNFMHATLISLALKNFSLVSEIRSRGSWGSLGRRRARMKYRPRSAGRVAIGSSWPGEQILFFSYQV